MERGVGNSPLSRFVYPLDSTNLCLLIPDTSKSHFSEKYGKKCLFLEALKNKWEWRVKKDET